MNARIKDKISIIFLFIVLSTSKLYGQPKLDTLNNNSIIELKRSNVDIEVVKLKIKYSFCNFDLSVKELDRLTKAGVNREIIAEMFKTAEGQTGTNKNNSSTISVSKNTNEVVVSHAMNLNKNQRVSEKELNLMNALASPGVYYVSSDTSLIEKLASIDDLLDFVPGTGERTDFTTRSIDFFKKSDAIKLLGDKSSLQIANSSPTFYIRLLQDISGSDLKKPWDAMKAEIKKGDRKFSYDFKLTLPFGTTFYASPQKVNSYVMKLSFKDLKPGSYLLHIYSRSFTSFRGSGAKLPIFHEFDIK